MQDCLGQALANGDAVVYVATSGNTLSTATVISEGKREGYVYLQTNNDFFGHRLVHYLKIAKVAKKFN